MFARALEGEVCPFRAPEVFQQQRVQERCWAPRPVFGAREVSGT